MAKILVSTRTWQIYPAKKDYIMQW